MNKGGSGRSALRPRRKLKTWKSRTGRKERDGKGVPLHPSIFFTGSYATSGGVAAGELRRANGEAETHRTAGGGAAGRLSRILSQVLTRRGGWCAAPTPALKDRAKLIASLRDERRRSRGRIESARPAGESETHRTAGGEAAGRR